MRFKTCTKAELVAMVDGIPDDALIAMRVPTGDYWGTVQASPIKGIEESQAIESSRLGGYKLLEDFCTKGLRFLNPLRLITVFVQKLLNH